MELYPMKMNPAFRHGKETPWGGRVLRDALMKDAPDAATGESCEVCASSGYESLIGNGKYAAMMLRVLGEKGVPEIFGDGIDELPVSVSLLDVAGETSGTVQSGTAWVILNREPDSVLEIGGETHRALPGDVFYLPAGCGYSLKNGVLLYSASAARQAQSACASPEKNEGTTVLARGGSVTYYVCDEGLEFCRLNLDGTMPLEPGRMLALTPTAPCRIIWGESEAMDLVPFTTIAVPAGLKNARLEGRSKLLAACISDQEKLRSILDYRAGNVSGL